MAKIKGAKDLLKELDVRMENHGSIILFRPYTPAAQVWLKENLAEDTQYLGDAAACEPRYALDILTGLREAGLVVRAIVGNDGYA